MPTGVRGRRASHGALVALAVSVLLASTQPLATASAAEGVAVGHAASSALRGVGDPYFPSYGNRGYDVTHYAITDAIDPRTGRLSGRTALTAEALGDRRRIALDLVLTPLSVRVDGERATFHQERGRKLVITPEGGLDAGDTFRVVVRYRGMPEEIVRGDLAPWISGSGEAVAMGEPEICAWWFACNDHPRDKATYDISVRVPQGRQAISNGVLVSRSSTADHTVWHWRMSDPMASYLAFVAAGRFQVQQTTTDGLPVVYAVSKRLSTRERQVGLRLLQRTPRITRWLSDQFGDYPFEAMGGVITSLFSGFALENQSRPVYPYLGGGDAARSVIVHELAHQWFGDSVSIRNWQDIWLNEGFASYAEWCYRAEHGGASVAAKLQAMYGARPASRPFWRLPIGDPGAENVFAAPVYQRGPMVLAALANRIGEEDLAEVLRQWVVDHRYGNAEIAEFVALAESVSGQDLGSFFTAWLYTGAKPAATAANGLA